MVQLLVRVFSPGLFMNCSDKSGMFNIPLCTCSDKKSGTLVLVCELLEMNIYELIRGKWFVDNDETAEAEVDF